MLRGQWRHSLWRLAAVAAFATGLACHADPAAAMEFTLLAPNDGHAWLFAKGVILPGDFRRLLGFLDTMEKVRHLAGVAVDSPGGLVVEAEQMAGTIHDMGLTVAVGAGHHCASACVLLFAAAHTRVVGAGAMVGVHRASLSGHETPGSLSATDSMAVEFADFGMPGSVVGKMRSTPPGGVTWLNEADFAAMHAMSLPKVGD